MKPCVLFLGLALAVGVPLAALATPIPGTYTSILRPPAHPGVLIGRVTVARQFPNSGNPKVFLGQSWNGSTLGTQWEIRCGVETTSQTPDSSQFNKVTGTGWITYHQTFLGGTFALYEDSTVAWGSGSGTLNTTSIISQVFFLNFFPMSSSFTGVTTGRFEIGCTLDFAMANGFGVGETPYVLKPASYPIFLAPNCAPADANHQWGTWGDTNDITVRINADCATPAGHSTWGTIKTLYR
jgi:hypothetical protein